MTRSNAHEARAREALQNEELQSVALPDEAVRNEALRNEAAIPAGSARRRNHRHPSSIHEARTAHGLLSHRQTVRRLETGLHRRRQCFHHRHRDHGRDDDGHDDRVRRARRVHLFLHARQSAEHHHPERRRLLPEQHFRPTQRLPEGRARAEAVADAVVAAGDLRRDHLRRHAACDPDAADGRRDELPAPACPSAVPVCRRDHGHASRGPDDRDHRGHDHDDHDHDDGRPRSEAAGSRAVPAQRPARAACPCRRRSATASRKCRPARPARASAAGQWLFPSRSSAAAEPTEPPTSRLPAEPRRRVLRAWLSLLPTAVERPGSDD